jgi:hypothetical protein
VSPSNPSLTLHLYVDFMAPQDTGRTPASCTRLLGADNDRGPDLTHAPREGSLRACRYRLWTGQVRSADGGSCRDHRGAADQRGRTGVERKSSPKRRPDHVPEQRIGSSSCPCNRQHVLDASSFKLACTRTASSCSASTTCPTCDLWSRRRCHASCACCSGRRARAFRRGARSL